MLKELVKVANRLDSLGLMKEADILDRWINKVAAGFSAQRNKEISDFLSTTLPPLFTSVAGSVEDRASKILSYPLNDRNPLYMVIVGLVKNTDRVGLSYDQVRSEIIKGFEFNKTKDTTLSRDTTSLYNTMTLKNGKNPPGAGAALIFDEVIVKSVFAQIQENKRSLQGATASGGVQAQTAEAVYTKPAAAPGKSPTKSPTRPSPSAPKRDWAYYLSKQTEPVGQAMEILWSNASMEMNMKPDYASFVSWYKSKGKNMNPTEAARKMFGDVLSKSKNPLVSSVLNSRAAADPENINALYSYVGINPKTYLPASGQEQTTAETRLRAISSAMANEADAAKAGRQAEDFRKTRVSEE